MSCGRGTGEDKTRSSATCTEGRGCKGYFFSRNVVFPKFSKFLDFCQQQMIHTPARASTRHPAKHRSKGLTCGLAAAKHRLHCYGDHNSCCCSGYEPARGEAPGHYNNLSNLYATVSFREIDVKSIPNKVYIEIYLALCGLQAAHRPTLAGLLLPSCLIVVSLWMVCETAAQHAGRRRLPVQSRLY